MIRCIVIDDEPLALKQLISYTEQTPELELVASCQSAREALEVMRNEHVDAMFVDINMPDLNGLDFVRSLEDRPMVVFTTAYSQYAVEGFQVNAIDYLLKPFGLDEFRRAAMRLKNQFELKYAASLSCVDEDDCIFLKSEYKIARIPIADILYVEAMSEYLRIHFSNGSRPITALLSMKRMEERLPRTFMRTHRSYIVNLKRIIEVNKSHIVLGPNVSLPIGDLYKDTFMNYINSKFLTK